MGLETGSHVKKELPRCGELNLYVPGVKSPGHAQNSYGTAPSRTTPRVYIGLSRLLIPPGQARDASEHL